MKPILLLDIDGAAAVAPSPGLPHLKNSWDRWNYTEILGAPLIYSPDLVNALNSLNDVIEVRILSSWLLPEPRHKRPIDLLLPAFGFDSFTLSTPAKGSENPDVLSEAMAKDLRWWKLNNVMDSINDEGRPIIWVDDDLSKKYSSRFISTYAKESGIPILLVKPFETRGIVPSDIVKIKDFVNSI